MANLKEETLEILESHQKVPDDIRWIGCKKFMISMPDFWKLADTEYDDGYGSPKVAEDLVVVGVSWWLERHEYDGSEWWEYKELPAKPSTMQMCSRVLTNGVGWNSLAKLNS